MCLCPGQEKSMTGERYGLYLGGGAGNSIEYFPPLSVDPLLFKKINI